VELENGGGVQNKTQNLLALRAQCIPKDKPVSTYCSHRFDEFAERIPELLANACPDEPGMLFLACANAVEIEFAVVSPKPNITGCSRRVHHSKLTPAFKERKMLP
jgi:hypothetical protein